MNVLVTGGAGFIGRWVVKNLLNDGHKVWVIDNLTNGSWRNIEEFINDFKFRAFIKGDIQNKGLLESLFKNKFDLCYHLAAGINVQDSLDDPQTNFASDLVGTFNLLELSREYGVRFIFMSTCMVYAQALRDKAISEDYPLKPASPYAGFKISGEILTLSYYYSYNLPVVILRPFNTYGPFQKMNNEGGVIPIFIHNKLKGKKLEIYGDGKQTRDFIYVEDCARFVVQAGYARKVNGEIINAGLGCDISINELAFLIAGSEAGIKHLPHIHPQSEVIKLRCDYKKAKDLLNWEPEIGLSEGIKRTEAWIRKNLA